MKLYASFFLGFFFLLYSIHLNAQDNPKAEQQSFAEIGVGLNSNHTVFSAAYHHNWHLSATKKTWKDFYIGTGLRFNAFGARDVTFISAPPSLYKTDNADSILAPAPAIYNVNIFLNLGYQITPKLQVGFDIDVAGFSFGPNGSPIFISGGVGQVVKVNPTPTNILLISSNNRGSLLSNLYVRYKISDKWGARLSYQTYYAEITTEKLWQTVPVNNQRFRHTTKLIGLGFNYNFR